MPTNITADQVTVRPEPGSETNESDATIASNLRADSMRKQMESKNTLQNNGSLYVGTGVLDPNTGVYQTQELQMKNSGAGDLNEGDDSREGKKEGFLAVIPNNNEEKIGYYNPFSYNSTTNVLTITWFEEE